MTLPELAPGAPVDRAAIEAWLAPIAPAERLAATPQDHAFHAEGDVWTHTLMAAEALAALPAYAEADAQARGILAAAVLLHDAGKPATTRIDRDSETGGERITSRGHSGRGESIARVALWRSGTPFGVREHVCALIRHHQVPFFGITKEPLDAERLAIRLSLLLRNDWLTAVAEADGRGRRCADPADQTRIVDHCGLWAEHCRELGVLATACAFASPHTRRTWCEADQGDARRSPDVPVHDDTTCEVTLMCGLPAAGKDSWLRTHAPELPVISLDAVRDELDIPPGHSPGEVIATARERAREFLRAGTSFAWNATNLARDLRSQLLGFFRGYRARTRIVYCEAAAADHPTRNRQRERAVPERVIERMLERWTVPDPTEAHAVVYAIPATFGDRTWPPTSAPPA